MTKEERIKEIKTLEESHKKGEIPDVDYAVQRFKKEGNISIIHTPTVESFISEYVVVRDKFWRGEISYQERKNGINTVFENYEKLLVSLGVTTGVPTEDFYGKYRDTLFSIEDKNFSPGDLYDTKSDLYSRNCSETRPIGEQFCRDYARNYKVPVDRLDKQVIV